MLPLGWMEQGDRDRAGQGGVGVLGLDGLVLVDGWDGDKQREQHHALLPL